MLIEYREKEREFREYYTEYYEFNKSGASVFGNLIKALIIDELPINDVLYRVKDCQESINKFKRKYRTELENKNVDYAIKNYISDLIGLRIICLYEDDIFRISKILRKNFEVIEITDKSSIIQSENQFGYKGYHMDLKLNTERLSFDEYKKYQTLKFEVQIRTIVQDAWSVVDHKIKYKKNINPDLQRGINRLAALFELADQEFFRIRNETKQKEKNAIENLNQSASLQKEPLNVFTFSSIIWNNFDKYNLAGNKIDGFVEEVKQAKSDINAGNILEALDKFLITVEGYAKTNNIYMNPYTKLRYCLFMYDQTAFKDFLFPTQKNLFVAWLEKNNDNNNNLGDKPI